MRFRTWNVRSLYRAASLKTAACELTKCNSDLMADESRVVVSQQTFFYGNENADGLFHTERNYISWKEGTGCRI
jgi:hypothetical protein